MSRLLFSCVFTFSIVSCGTNKDEGGKEPVHDPNPLDSTSKDGNGGKPKLPLDDDHLNVYCRTEESDGKKYCIKQNEWPSDLKPENKVAPCYSGLFDHESCKPINIMIREESFWLYAGDVLRASGKGKDLTLVKIQVDSEPYDNLFKYDYATKYDKSVFASGFGDIKILLQRFGSNQRRIDVTPNILGYIPPQYKHVPVSFDYKGVKFQTGGMAFSKFKELCTTLQNTDADEADPWKFEDGNLGINCHRRIAGWLDLACDNNRQYCNLNTVNLRYAEKAS